MELTIKQQEGLNKVIECWCSGAPYVCISGYAGSGKTTLVSYAIAALGLDPEEEVAYVAYTGKAAKVLASKGNPNATTIHKLIYRAKRMPSGGYYYTLRNNFEKPYKAIVVDEVSMVPKKMWFELLQFGVFIIACGDPGQLPPVSKDEANGVLDYPHIFLDEIMRQAQESEIIRLSMDIREGKPVTPFRGNEIQIITRNDVIDGMYSWADQILVGTNAMRVSINQQVRKMRGIETDDPVEGDKIISLHNQWNTLSDSEIPLTNGTIGTLTSFSKQKIWLPEYISDTPIDILHACFDEDDDGFAGIPIDYKCLTTGESALTPRQEYQLAKSKKYCGPLPMPFSYAYAVTTHKAQGSEWPHVMVFEERFPFDREEHKRWLYTAVTRASEKLVLVLKN